MDVEGPLYELVDLATEHTQSPEIRRRGLADAVCRWETTSSGCGIAAQLGSHSVGDPQGRSAVEADPRLKVVGPQSCVTKYVSLQGVETMPA